MRNTEKRNYDYMPDGSSVSDVKTKKTEKKFKMFAKILFQLVYKFEKMQKCRFPIIRLKLSSFKQSITKNNKK